MIFLATNMNSDELNNLFSKEKEFMEYSINSQKNLKNIVLEYMQNLANFTSSDLNSANSVLSFLENLKKSLELCNNNISLLEILLSLLSNTISAINNNINIDEAINLYNSKYISLNTAIMQSTLTIEYCLQKANQLKVEEHNNEECNIEKPSIEEHNIEEHYIKKSNIEEHNTEEHYIEKPTIEDHNAEEHNIIEHNTEETKKNDDLVLPKIPISQNNIEIEVDNAFIDNTLVVSEITGNVTLPYSIDQLEVQYKENEHKYSSLSDLVRKKYTLPISRFKNPFSSRFREAYRLMRYKENASVLDALELGIELMFNYNLHPAIISACKNLDELDIYLDYLEEGETNKFNCFDIIFEFPPAVVKNKNAF